MLEDSAKGNKSDRPQGVTSRVGEYQQNYNNLSEGSTVVTMLAGGRVGQITLAHISFLLAIVDQLLSGHL